MASYQLPGGPRVQGTSERVTAVAGYGAFQDVTSSGGGITGSLSVTETGPDIFSSSGIVITNGILSATEGTFDTLSCSGFVLISGSVSATETTVDVFAGIGSTGGAIFGSLNATESTVDVFTSSGTILVSGSLIATESTADTLSISGDVLISGTLAATEGTSDVFFATNVAPAANKTVNSKWLVSLGSSGGTVQLQMASEVNGVDVTLQDGLLFLKYRKI